MTTEIMTMKQFSELLVCEHVGLPICEPLEIDLEMKMIGKAEEIETEPVNLSKTTKYVHRKLDNTYFIPPDSETNHASVALDYAKLFAHQINLCIKGNDIKKMFLRDMYFDIYTDARTLWKVVRVYIRFSFREEPHHHGNLDEHIDMYFCGLSPSSKEWLIRSGNEIS